MEPVPELMLMTFGSEEGGCHDGDGAEVCAAH